MNWELRRSYEHPGMVVFEYEINGERKFSAWDGSRKIYSIMEDLKKQGAEHITYIVY